MVDFTQGFPISSLSHVQNTLLIVFLYAGWQLVVLLFLVVQAQRKFKESNEHILEIRTPPWIKLFRSYHSIFVHIFVTSLTWGTIDFLLQQGKLDGINGTKTAGYLTAIVFGYRILSGLNLWIVDYTLIKPNARLNRPGQNMICSPENKATASQLLYQLLDINVFIELWKTFDEDRPEVTIQFRDIRTMEALFSSSFTSICALDFILESHLKSSMILVVPCVMAYWSITSVLIKRDEVVFFEFREEANRCSIVPHPLYVGRRFWRFCEVGSRLMILSLIWASGRSFGFITFGLCFVEATASLVLHLVYRRDKIVYEFIYALEFVFVHPNIAMEANDMWKNGYYSFRFYEHCILLVILWLYKNENWNLTLWTMAFVMTVITRVGFFVLRFYMSLPSFDKLIESDQYPDEIEIQIRQHPHYLHEYRQMEPMQIAIDAGACNNFKWLRSISGARRNLFALKWEGKNLRAWDISLMDFQRVNLFNTNFRDAICIKTKFNHAQLSGANFHRANMQQSRLKGAQLKGADLSMARLNNANAEGANFSNANMVLANLTAANFRKAKMMLCKLHGAKMNKCLMNDVDFSGANLFKASFVAGNLSNAKLRFTKCKHAKFSTAILSGAQFFGAEGYEDEVGSNDGLAVPVRESLALHEMKDDFSDGYVSSSSSENDGEESRLFRRHSTGRRSRPISRRTILPIDTSRNRDVEEKREIVNDNLRTAIRQISANSDDSSETAPLGLPRNNPQIVASNTVSVEMERPRRQESEQRIGKEDKRPLDDSP